MCLAWTPSVVSWQDVGDLIFGSYEYVNMRCKSWSKVEGLNAPFQLSNDASPGYFFCPRDGWFWNRPFERNSCPNNFLLPVLKDHRYISFEHFFNATSWKTFLHMCQCVTGGCRLLFRSKSLTRGSRFNSDIEMVCTRRKWLRCRKSTATRTDGVAVAAEVVVVVVMNTIR